jgi:hypothetical protein
LRNVTLTLVPGEEVEKGNAGRDKGQN